MNTSALRARVEYLSNADAAIAATVEDPRAANCRGFQVDSRNQIVGIELVVVRIPSAPYELYRAEMLDPYSSGGNPIVKAVALDDLGVVTGERIVIAWPFPELNAPDSPQGPGNPENNFNISSKFDAAHGVIGPLAFHMIDAQGATISDVVGGYGQAAGYGHIGGRVTFRKRAAVIDPEPEPEPDGDALTRIAVAVERLAKHLGRMMDALAIPHMAHGTAVVHSKKLNVRAEPVTTAPILGQLAPGELVTVWALEDAWAIVQTVSGLTGWAAAEYMTLGELIP